MFLSKKYKHNFLKPQFLLASFFVSILSILFSVHSSVSALSLYLSLSTPTVNFQFNQAENAASAFKEDMAIVQYDTDNSTGFTAYVSSIDEDTSLNHVDPSVTQKITSITTPGGAATFGSKNWGYLANQTTASTTSFNPIPKASQPDQALSTSLPEIAKFFLHFGVKTGPDLPAGAYSKKILVTTITNHVPTTATLKVGKGFRYTVNSLGRSSGIKEFKKASSAPAPGTSTEVASTIDSEMPVYLWYDATSKTVFWWSDADTVYANEDSNAMFSDLGDVERIDMTGINTSRVKDMSYMFHSYENLYKHIELGSFDTSNVEDMSYMFATHGMKTMENIDPVDFSRFNTSKVKNMKYMFYNSFLPSLDIRNFDTRNVVDMQYTFAGLKNVTHLDLHGFDVSKVNNIGAIFSNNPTLVSLNLANWRLDSIHTMDSLFAGMHTLSNLNLSGFTTKNVTDMHHMFNECHALTALDLSSFDTSKVTDMNNMFRDNFALKNLNLSSFNTSNVTNMAEMFRHSGAIYPLDVSSFDTRRVTDMTNMFYWTLMAPENGTLDISNFDTRSLNTAAGMFNYTKAKTIYVSDQFTTTNITPGTEMFMTNTNLVGGNGTQYVYPNNSSQYAHIDAPGNPGYFTRKP